MFKVSLSDIPAWIISIIFHPIIYASLGAYIMLLSLPEFKYFHPDVIWRYLKLVFMLTYVFPIVAIPLYFLILRTVKVEVSKKHIRLFLLLTTVIIYSFSYKILSDYSLFQYVNLYILLCALLMLVSFVVTYFWQISLHMIGIGGFLGLLLTLLFAGIAYFEMLIAIFVFISGLVAYARLKLKAHVPSQVYIGFATGGIISFIFLSVFFI